jgi:stage V sporulation protein SpoVS
MKEQDYALVLKVKSDGNNSTHEERRENVKKLAGAISHALREHKAIYIRTVGDGCIDKTVKALCIARKNLSNDDLSLAYRPGFIDVTIGEEEISGVGFEVFIEKGEFYDVDLNDEEENTLKVSSDSNVESHKEKIENRKKLASAITYSLKDTDGVILKCLKRGSVVKAIKSIIYAVGQEAMKGKQIRVWSDYYPVDSQEEGKSMTGIAFFVYEEE